MPRRRGLPYDAGVLDSALPDHGPTQTPAAELGLPPGTRLSTAIARQFLRGGNYPWRRFVGAVHRERSRKIGGRRFVVQRPGGVSLDCWYCPAPLDRRDPAKLPVLISHGIFEIKERYFDRAAWLNARGHDVLLFDHRTHGRSTGKRLTMGVQERDDVTAVLDAAEQRGLIEGTGNRERGTGMQADSRSTPQPDPRSPVPVPGRAAARVVTLGFSLGGGTVLQHAATDPRVAGVVALAPFADFTAAIETFRQCFAPWLGHDWVHRGFGSAATEAGFAVGQASALDAIEHIDAPILLVEAGKDTYLPPSLHTEVLRQRRGDKPLTVLNIPDARHLSLVRKRWPQLDAGLGAFLDSLIDER